MHTLSVSFCFADAESVLRGIAMMTMAMTMIVAMAIKTVICKWIGV